MKEGRIITSHIKIISSITRTFPCPKTSSKGIVNRKIIELMVIDKKGETSLYEKSKPPTLGFKDREKVA